MAVYAVGDIQGCYAPLQKLLAKLPFDPERDRLWTVGDLVNRGPDSLGVLRWALRCDYLTTVLGNHDIHLLMRSWGLAKAKRRDTLEDVLEAPDCQVLLAWLRQRPLLYREGNVLLFHGGLHPSWSVEEAEDLAREVEDTLRSDRAQELLSLPESKIPERWDGKLSGLPRLRLALRIFTTLRIFGPGGDMAFNFSGSPALAPVGYLPWFAVPGRKAQGQTLVFGHWASLGLKLAPGFFALDSGCVWGRELTAVRLTDQAIFQVPGVESRP